MKEQAGIADFLDRETAKIDALIAKIQEAIERLKEYRNTLVSAAVTGKIDVRKEVTARTRSGNMLTLIDKCIHFPTWRARRTHNRFSN